MTDEFPAPGASQRAPASEERTLGAGTDDFAQRVRAHFPEGLTAVFVIGGTRTSYLLSAGSGEPGSIDPETYGRYGIAAYIELMGSFFELGGQNLVIPGWAHQYFSAAQTRTTGGWRGPEFQRRFLPLARLLAGAEFARFYREMQVDPYFCGIDTLLSPSADGAAQALGAALRDFQASWHYGPGRRKVVWEIASIPLYSFWRATARFSEAQRAALEADLASADDLDQLYRKLYAFYARVALGTDLPVPHFYLANNRNGDLKLRGPLTLALSAGNAALRCFYVPYPTLFVTRDTLRTVIEDLISGGGLRSHTEDYRGVFTDELLRSERERALRLRADPRSTLGLSRPF